MLPNLPSKLDIVVLQLSNQVEGDPRFQRQFRTDFRVRKKRVITWLQYLKDHHPDYRYITISLDCIDALLVDRDVSSLFTAIIDHEDPLGQPALGEPIVQDLPVSAELPPPNSQSMVPNLNITTTEVDLILEEISGRNPIPPGLPAPSIRQTPIDEASGKDRIFAMAFPTLYPTGLADFNASRLWKVDLNDYA